MSESLYNPISGDLESFVVGRDAQGSEFQGTVLRLERNRLIFEAYTPVALLHLSEVLSDFKISVNGKPLYFGRAVVCSLIQTGTATVCEASLESGWRDVDLTSFLSGQAGLQSRFELFLSQWQKLYRILPEYKQVVADVQTFLTDLRYWLQEVELGIRSLPASDRLQKERDAAEELKGPLISALVALFGRFEEACRGIEEPLQPVHRSFCRKQLHPFLMSSPFMHRIYTKPLGYAGDYEMMNMISRNDYEGSSLFGKLLNAYILDQAPARSVRNRVDYLTVRLQEETLRVSQLGRSAHIYSIGCGPAGEAQNFIAQSPLANRAQFRLLDFNEETLMHAGSRLDEVMRKSYRSASVKLIKKSVYYLLKDATKPGVQETYDFIYCAGLYDYLSDRVCKTLNSLLYDQLLPGGLLVVSNFDPVNPIRNMMEYAFEWFLLYRTGKQMAALAPDRAPEDACRVIADSTGCNVFLEVRKPRSNK